MGSIGAAVAGIFGAVTGNISKYWIRYLIGLVSILGIIGLIWYGLHTYRSLIEDNDRLTTENALYKKNIKDLHDQITLSEDLHTYDMASLKELLSRRMTEKNSLEQKLSLLQKAQEKGYPGVVQPSVAAGKVSKDAAKCEIPPAILYALSIVRDSQSGSSGKDKDPGTNSGR